MVQNLQQTVNTAATGNYGFTGLPKAKTINPANGQAINNAIGGAFNSGMNALSNFGNRLMNPQVPARTPSAQPGYSSLQGLGYQSPIPAGIIPQFMPDTNGNFVKPQTQPIVQQTSVVDKPVLTNTGVKNEVKANTTTIDPVQPLNIPNTPPVQSFTSGQVGVGGAGLNTSGSNLTAGQSPSKPFQIPTSGFTSANLNPQNSSYSDILNKQKQTINQYQQAYDQYANFAGAEKTGSLNDLLRENQALYSGDTQDFGFGVQNLVKNQDLLRQAAREIPTQTALMKAEGLGKSIGYQSEVFQNQLKSTPGLESVQQAPDGSVIGIIRDPMTGLTRAQNFGNPMLGTQGFEGQGSFDSIGGGGQGGGFGQISETITLPQNADGTYMTAEGGSVNSDYAKRISSLPPVYQPLVKAGAGGVAYLDNTNNSIAPQVATLLSQSLGIPVLDREGVAGMQEVKSLYDILNQVDTLADSVLRSGVVGKGLNSMEAVVNKYTGFKPILNTFNNLKAVAGKLDTRLMGGIGSGFRQNSTNLDATLAGLSTSFDNLEESKTKTGNIRALLDQAMRQTFPGYKGSGETLGAGQQYAPINGGYSGGFVQTKVGAIPTDW